MMANVPACTYQVVARLEGRINLLGAQTMRGRDRHPVITQARSVGADAVIGFTANDEYDSDRRKVATNWHAIAIDFSNPGDPNCYR